jgi:hypothetical protein
MERLIIEDDTGTSVVDFLKGIDMKAVIDLVHAAWTEISEDILRKSWRKIFPIVHKKPSAPCIPVVPELYKFAVSDDEFEDANNPKDSLAGGHNYGLEFCARLFLLSLLCRAASLPGPGAADVVILVNVVNVFTLDRNSTGSSWG